MDDNARLGTVDVVIGTLVASAVVHVWLVPEHLDEPVLAAAFGAAAAVTATVAFLLARRVRVAARLAAALFAALLVAYPVAHVLADGHVDALDLATKAVEAVGLVAALRLRGGEDAPLAPVDVLVGVFVGTLLLSALGHTHSY